MALGRDTSITWYGHSCFEVRTPGGRTILMDPWFGNPKSPKPVDQVDRCDILLLSHGHFDHMGPGGSDVLPIASRFQPAWPAIHELSLWAGRRVPGGVDAITGMNKGGTVDAKGVKVTMTSADHSAGDWNADGSTTLYLGEPVGVIVELENGFRYYFAGDTIAFGDMQLIGELFQPELAFLPIGGHYTMDPRQAALAAGLLGVTSVVPMHYGTFPILVGTPSELRSELEKRDLGHVEVFELQPGQTLE